MGGGVTVGEAPVRTPCVRQARCLPTWVHVCMDAAKRSPTHTATHPQKFHQHTGICGLQPNIDSTSNSVIYHTFLWTQLVTIDIRHILVALRRGLVGVDLLDGRPLRQGVVPPAAQYKNNRSDGSFDINVLGNSGVLLGEVEPIP
jgi:hypothetical protein